MAGRDLRHVDLSQFRKDAPEPEPVVCPSRNRLLDVPLSSRGSWGKRRQEKGRSVQEIDRLLSLYRGKSLSEVPHNFRGVTAAEADRWSDWKAKQLLLPAGWLTVDQINARLEKTKNKKRT